MIESVQSLPDVKHSDMRAALDDYYALKELREAGEAGIFTPMFLVHARKPE